MPFHAKDSELRLLRGLRNVVILGVMLFVCAEVVMRYAFNAPIPGHLEGSELLVPVIVFLALSFTQATHGHVGMELLVDNIPATAQRWLNIITLTASIFICAVIAWFSYKHTYQLWEYDDVTMTNRHPMITNSIGTTRSPSELMQP